MRIWFNKTFSSIHTVLRNIRESDPAHNVTLIISHTHPHVPGMAVADEKFLEPENLPEEDYLAWALAFCQEHQIDWFWPGKQARAISAHIAQFNSIGTQVVSVADTETLTLLNDKAAFYATLPQAVAIAPEAIAINNLTEFDAAYALLRSKYEKVCVKPAISVFGLGFRVIDEAQFSIQHLLKGLEYQIPLSELRLGMANTEHFDTLLVMEFLPGNEWSVDCVANQGQLWCAVQRKKPLEIGYSQVIDNNPQIADMVARLTAHFRLNGLFNIQFRDSEQGPKLLEINARPSGGVGMACKSGVNLASMLIESLASKQPTLVQQINYGRQISEVSTPVILHAA